jgi:glutathione S-transferase
LKTQFPAWTEVMDKRIAANSSPHYAVGNKISIADFVVGSWAYGSVLNKAAPIHPEMKEILNKHVHLKEYLEHLGEHDLKEFL